MSVSRRPEVWLRFLVAALGGALVLAALLADGVGSNPLQDFGATQLLALLYGSALVAIAVLGRRTVGAYRATALFLLNMGVVVVSFELVAGLLLSRAGESAAAAPHRSPSTDISYYRAEPWGESFWQEHVVENRRIARYHPFVLWRRPPFVGTHINVDPDGLRVTSQAACGDSAYRVFVFGGSTVWGWGSPDWGTIPAQLAQVLSRRGDAVCVVNYGQNAFVSTQELIELVLQLQAGNVPDVVVFYHGFNDSHSAFLEGEAGSHYRRERIASILEGREVGEAANPVVTMLNETSTVRLLRRIMPAPARPATSQTPGPTEPIERDVDGLADDVVAVYLQNLEAVAALAREFGFDYAFFWQPSIDQSGKPLTAEEQGMLRDPRVADALPLISAVYERIGAAARGRERLHYLADAFDAVEPLVWIDFVHVTPEGNRLVAEQIAERIEIRPARAED